MRMSSVLVAVLCVAPGATAQVIDLTPLRTFGLDDGSSELSMVLNMPAQASDWYNVDFNSDASGSVAVALWADLYSIGWTGTNFIGTTTSDAAGNPDIANAVMQKAFMDGSDGLNSERGYATPCMTLGSDLHVVFNHSAGDSSTWLAADTDGPVAGRSFFSSTSYATGATAASGNWRMGWAGWDSPTDGRLLVNGGASASVPQNNDVCLTFSACAPGIPSSLYLCSPTFFGPLLPNGVTTTGGISGGPCSNQWTICTTLSCDDPTGGPFGFCCVYLDPCDTKPNGKPKAKVSSIATLSITPNQVCNGCFGQKDDGIFEAAWKIQVPSGAGDWLNVNHGAPAPLSGVTTLTGIQVSAWHPFWWRPGKFWAEVGIYADVNGVPDLAGVIAKTTSTTAWVPAGSGDDGPYPMTLYDLPDIPVSAASGWHVAVQWPSGDTCLWLGADVDGTDSSCGIPIPSNGSTSGFTANDYTTGVQPVTFGNWHMKIDWN